MMYNEPTAELPEQTRNIHRALRSLVEELEAIDWYNQRVAVSKDQDLAAVMAHNRDEEIEHASMVLEWLRRKMDGWDLNLRRYLFTQADITSLEEPALLPGRTSDLGIGNLRKEG